MTDKFNGKKLKEEEKMIKGAKKERNMPRNAAESIACKFKIKITVRCVPLDLQNLRNYETCPPSIITQFCSFSSNSIEGKIHVSTIFWSIFYKSKKYEK